MSTSIEWADDVWNPTLGCSEVSPGCDNCYAASFAHRGMTDAHRGLTVTTADGVRWTGQVRCLPDRLDIPLRRRKPTMWFVDSMSDLFHPEVPSDFIARVWETMGQAHWHIFQVLTKRPGRMAQLLRLNVPDPWPNVWLGTSIENNRCTWRADRLRRTPAAVRWLSLEPLLGPLPSLDLTGIDWVVVGGESGPGARPMHPDWARDIRDRCIKAGIPLLVKQWGAWRPRPYLNQQPADVGDHTLGGFVLHDPRANDDRFASWTNGAPRSPVFMDRVGKKKAGRHLDGHIWHQFPGDRP